jgi:hypothetical protein
MRLLTIQTPVISYNKDLLLLLTGTGTVIKNGNTDSVSLDQTFIMSNGTAKQEPAYDLLICSSKWLSPVAIIHVKAKRDDVSKTMSFDPVTVTPDLKTGLKQASEFYQTIAAYPDTKLAKNYLDALNTSAQNNIPDIINNFFKSTVDYKQVTEESVMFVDTSYKLFPFAWAGYADSAAYFLYSSDTKKTTFQGKLTMNKTGDIDVTKSNGGYTCQFVPAVNPLDTSKTDVDLAKAKTLTYVDGIFTDDTNSDVPGIAFKGSFQLKRTFTKDPRDTKIMAVMGGSINGQIAVGFDAAQLSNPDDPTQDWLNSLFHPKTAAEIFNSVMTILGALMMLHFACSLLYGIGKWVREKVTSEKPYTNEELQAEKARIESELEARNAGNFKKVAGEKAALPDSPQDALEVASGEKGKLSDLVSRGKAQAGCDDILDNLDTLDEYGDDLPEYLQQINDNYDAVSALADKLTNAEIADLKATLAELKPKLQELTVRVQELSCEIR